MLPKKRLNAAQTQRWTFPQLFGLVKRNPVMITRWVLCGALVGTVCGLFAGLYWNILELMTHALEQFEGPSLLVVMPLAGLVGFFLAPKAPLIASQLKSKQEAIAD